MKHAPVKLPDADAPSPLPAVRNRAAGIVNRLSSFALAWDIDNRLSAKTHDNQALGTADYQYDVLGRRVAKDSGGFVGKTVTLWWNMREVADYETTGTTPGPNITEKFIPKTILTILLLPVMVEKFPFLIRAKEIGSPPRARIK